MLSPRLMLVARRLPLNLASVVLFGLIPMASWGQQPPAAPSAQAVPQPAQPQAIHLQDYSQPRSAFPKVFQPYKAQELAQPNLGNSPRIDALLHDGKIILSIDDAIALALENNLDLEIARFNLNIAATDLLRAKSGANILGVNTGIVQNTPGGGVGGLGGAVGSGTGGTTIAAGGAGTGTNGLVGSTLGIGSPITGFDPALTGTLQLDKNNAESTSALSPVPILSQNTYTANFAYTQGFQWGTALSVGFNNSHLTTNNPTSLLSPSLGSNFQLRVTQNLSSRIRVPAQYALHPHRQEQSRNFRRCLPPASPHHGGSDRKYVLGSSVRLRKCSRAGGVAHLCAEGLGRLQTTGASGHRASRFRW